LSESRRERSTEGFFGRRLGKPIRPAQATALEAGRLRYGIDLSTPPPSPLSSLFPAPVDRVRLEIGFGAGEHLLSEVEREPSSGFIGVEPFVNGLAKAMSALAAEPRDTVRIHDDDAIALLDWLPDASIAEIDLLYPDPWPKRRHWKRRFVSRANLDRFARVLVPGGLFRFASDVDTYVNWTLLACRVHPSFAWEAEDAADWHTPYPGWASTRYEAKALREGRRPAYLRFRRV
jgi:tRNA (guanine-N7-)-methyltransferase